jgi:hypothetical protein
MAKRKAAAFDVYAAARKHAEDLGFSLYLNHGVNRGGILTVTDKKASGTPRGVYINPEDCPADRQAEHEA